VLDIKEAYEILGLTEGANRVEIEKKYGKLVRKHHVDKSENSIMDKINEAYNRLIANENEIIEAAEPKKKPNPLFKAFGLNEKKTSNFIYYYKFHFIIGLILILCTVYLLNSMFNRHTPDLNVMFVGEYLTNTDDSNIAESIKKEINKNYPEIKDIKIQLINAASDVKTQQDATLITKANLEILYGEEDVVILDKKTYSDSVESGVYLNLDSFTDKLGIDIKANKDYKDLIKGQKEPHLYGVDVGLSKIVKNSDIIGKEYIASIRTGGKRLENAKKFLKLLLK